MILPLAFYLMSGYYFWFNWMNHIDMSQCIITLFNACCRELFLLKIESAAWLIINHSWFLHVRIRHFPIHALSLYFHAKWPKECQPHAAVLYDSYDYTCATLFSFWFTSLPSVQLTLSLTHRIFSHITWVTFDQVMIIYQSLDLNTSCFSWFKSKQEYGVISYFTAVDSISRSRCVECRCQLCNMRFRCCWS